MCIGNLKLVFEEQNQLFLFFIVVNSQRLLCSQKAGVKCSTFVLKLSGIQIHLIRVICTIEENIIGSPEIQTNFWFTIKMFKIAHYCDSNILLFSISPY